MTRTAWRAALLSTPTDPRFRPIRYEADGLLVIENGLVLARGPYVDLAPRFADIPVTHLPDKLILPGFVDAHVHYPQTDRIAAHGAQLLDWLDRHVFPAELAFANRAHADAVAAFFLDELLRNGTTSALIFSTVHACSVEALFDAALTRGMRIISGKVLMDQNAPEGLCDRVESGHADSAALIARWRGRGRIGYAVSPRFALTSSDAQLASAGRLVADNPDVLMHTHLSENSSEIAAVAARWPDSDYLGVYARFGLVGARSVFAHGVHLDQGSLGRMAAAGSAIAHCPTSNLFLGSGLFDCLRACDAGVTVGLGTDIGAGTSFSQFATMGAAYQIAQLRGQSLDPFHALYLATMGGAKALHVADKVGALEEGQEADFVVVDPAATPLLARRTAGASLHDTLFALQILGDDRAIARTYVAGALVHDRDRKDLT